MAKGIIYIMETVVPGLIKIGKTGAENFESRMYNLERHGYNNVVGLKRRFAIEVDDYDEKEALLDSLFEKSRLHNSELFALDVDMVIQLLSSFDGKQIYPQDETKEQTFTAATENRRVKADMALIPDGIYYLNEFKKGFGDIKAKMKVESGVFTVLKGSSCCPVTASWAPAPRVAAVIVNNILEEDMECNSPSTAAWIPMGQASNGWMCWKTADGQPIDVFRQSRLKNSES